ncbi:hypothetical protein AGABI1DRAFT_125746 [Agaricus bisporus var. burnettii JB137-S8]|uniref:F-box domain-containing protein n=1 Tax=Agaricus bisporus var. burnettii (strain JB137-S8 / ATCC MYA-4627 / FGSC 10392) TaxID=597362 RepID=K5Y5B4_AGABU|nr:uncharacterized protein AGABI1DRAFT_125746 [Agaricus bisporus var. burnettii JB137-S8]EKM83290.1 hypothetical protein AGABI1DRAFT_125746 [Agaricus bisporus var. burnettii JB137-S8]
MSSPELLRNCDYLRVDNFPYNFTAKLAGLSRINEHVDQIDSHIHELHKLRGSLLHRSNQLRSPVYALPDEIASSIFFQSIGSEASGPALLRQAIILSSVSARWRHIVSGTPAFWRKIDLEIERGQRPVDSIASLIEHCALHTKSLDVSLVNHVTNEDAVDYLHPITRVLSSPDITQNVKILTVSGIPTHWAPLLSSFSFLNALSIKDGIKKPRVSSPMLALKAVELGGLRSLTQVHIHVNTIHSITLPPSVEILHLLTSNPDLIIPVLYQCPHLREVEYENRDSSRAISFPEPLNLRNLKKMVWVANIDVETMDSAQNLGIPAMEYLELTQFSAGSTVVPAAIITFCHRGAASLSTLILHNFSREWSVTQLRQLFRHSLPNLQKLELRRWSYQPLLEAISALGDEHDNPANAYTPVLQYLTLGDDMSTEGGFDPTPFFRALAALLKHRKAGINFPFHLTLFTYFTTENDLKKLPQSLRDELKLIVNTRQVKIIRWRRHIPWLVPPSM